MIGPHYTYHLLLASAVGERRWSDMNARERTNDLYDHYAIMPLSNTDRNDAINHTKS
jgi:hypothetical protein